MNINFNNRLRQLLLLALVIWLAIVLIRELYIFLPGLLGGITLYILSRNLYFRLTMKKKWKKGWTAILFILAYLVIIAIPVYFSVRMVTPTINDLLANQEKIVQDLQSFSDRVESATGVKLLSAENTKAITQKISAFLPKLINSTAGFLTNLLMMFFLLFYLLVGGRSVEKYLSRIIPLKPQNIDILASETKSMIRANALGIPIICIVQGATASLGYWMFGINNWGLWGFITGVFAFFPIVGTMIIWVPLVISMFAIGNNWQATWLGLYSLIITGNVDYITRIGLLKRMGDVHPMVTVLGVIAGLGLFGFIGLIFGPLLVSYFLILVKIYMNEFTDMDEGNEEKLKKEMPEGD